MTNPDNHAPLPFELLPQYMQEALTKFNGEAEVVLKTFLKTVEAKETPKIIYHYTNDIGLKGILDTGQI